MPQLLPLRAAFLSALLGSAGWAAAGPVIEVKPGLWASDSEVWINGQSLRPGLQALRAKVRSGLTDAQKAQLDREQAAEKQACLRRSRRVSISPATWSRRSAAPAPGSAR